MFNIRPLTSYHPYTANKLKAILFQEPDWTPCQVVIPPATWMKHRQALEEILLAHPRLFPSFTSGGRDFDTIHNPFYQLGVRTDCWGTIWENIEPGLDSHPVGSPLEDWQALETYSPPRPGMDDLLGPYDWYAVGRQLQALRDARRLVVGQLPHGSMYMRLYYMRGFENLMLDFATDDPRIWQLIEMVEAYNLEAIQKQLDLGAELMVFGDDLGLQHSLPMRPAMWRKYLKPSLQRMFGLCREVGALVFLHTDGHILEIIPDLIEAGVNLLNPQFRANGLPGLDETTRGQVAVELDLDRQMFPFATPEALETHIREAHAALHLPKGGLLLSAECGPDVPLENIAAICTALENVCWNDR